jgi:glycopeptide antibiotics resistance protein
MQKRFISAFILIVYSAIVIRLLVFKTMLLKIGHLQFRFDSQTGPANLVPFKTILPYLRGERGRLFAVINLVGNIAVFVPIGFLVPLVYRRMTWQKAIALAVAVGLAIEGMEVLFRVGIFDVDDVILNAFGVMIGYWVFTIFKRRSGNTAASARVAERRA